MNDTMNGAESLVHTLIGAGIDTCFVNPGTSEMHFVAALDRIPGMRCVLGLFEGVLTGAADGYARMADKPAAVLLHCGPGLGNGIANLHNARRANSPIVNIVGDQATYHSPLDPPLTTDTEGLARPVSRWLRTSVNAVQVGADAAEAVQASQEGAGGVATLVLPSDVCWDSGGKVANRLPPRARPQVDEALLAEAAKLIRSGERTLFYAGGAAMREPGLTLLARIAAATGVQILAPVANGRIERGAGRYPIRRMPYFVEPARAALEGVRNVILLGEPSPVAFFAYPGKPQTPLPDDAHVHILARPEDDVLDALERLADRLNCADSVVDFAPRSDTGLATGEISSKGLAQSLACMLPEGAVVVDESNTFGTHLFPGTAQAAPHDWLQLTGGAIGCGIPMSVGAALGAPGRRVVTLQADGSAAYTLQGLWTQARERLDVTTVILSNRRYAILLHELQNVGAAAGETAQAMMSLDDPAIDWVSLGRSLGVEGGRADTMEQFNALFAASLKRSGPFLIELTVP